jgi:hypothetical protein
MEHFGYFKQNEMKFTILVEDDKKMWIDINQHSWSNQQRI